MKTLSSTTADRLGTAMQAVRDAINNESRPEQKNGLKDALGLLEQRGNTLIYAPAPEGISRQAMCALLNHTDRYMNYTTEPPTEVSLSNSKALEIRAISCHLGREEQGAIAMALAANVPVTITRWPETISFQKAAEILKNRFYPDKSNNVVQDLLEDWCIRTAKPHCGDHCAFRTFLDALKTCTSMPRAGL